MHRTSYFTQTKETGDPPAADPDYSDGRTREAWEKYLSGESENDDGDGPVRNEIFQSWKRSVSLGVDATKQQSRKIHAADALHELRRKNHALRLASRSALARLEPHLTDARAVMLLTEKDGVIIDAIGDPSVLDKGQDIHLEIGGVWNENAIGTNGIGTALRTGKPTYVHGAEHFCQSVQAWTCAGAPIFDPFDRSVLGVVDLSGPPHIFRRHNVALVMAAAREIEIALAEQQHEERTLLLEAFLGSENSHANNGVLLLDNVGRILFSRGLGDQIDKSHPELAVGRQLLPLNGAMTDVDIRAALPPDLETEGVERLELDGHLRGAALFLKQSRGMRLTLPDGMVRIKARANVEEEEIVIVGAAPKMLEAIELAKRAASADVTVLVQGETGVGKELFARLIHHRLAREDTPYVTVNCAAISKELIGAELFGHVEGAFTGAVRGGKPGKFELASGGVLCLDEIGDMPVEMQPYLLRALEQKAVYRIGDNERRSVNVQLVAMTNRNLRDDVEAGRFRRDLFYRLSIVVIDVPPLRERGQDILMLLRHFNTVFAKRFDREPLVFPSMLLDRLCAYRWPGNVRELRNMMERLYLLKSDQDVTVSDLPGEMFEPMEGFGLATYDEISDDGVNLESIEAKAIRRAMQAEKGNLTRVAAKLGISRPTLYRKIKQYDIPRP